MLFFFLKVYKQEYLKVIDVVEIVISWANHSLQQWPNIGGLVTEFCVSLIPGNRTECARAEEAGPPRNIYTI